MADGCKKVPVRTVCRSACQLSRRPRQPPHRPVCHREVDQQLHAYLLGAAVAAGKSSHLPACHRPIPATCLTHKCTHS